MGDRVEFILTTLVNEILINQNSNFILNHLKIKISEFSFEYFVYLYPIAKTKRQDYPVMEMTLSFSFMQQLGATYSTQDNILRNLAWYIVSNMNKDGNDIMKELCSK